MLTKIPSDLAFGEPFGCLDRAGYHPWVAAVNQTFRAGAVMLGIKQLGLERIVLPIFRLLIKGRQVHRQQIQDKLQRRVELKTERHDLIAPLLTIHDKLGWERLRVNASLLVIAGSETTATLLSGTTYLLLSNPDALRQLTEEVRSAFKSDDEITLLSVGNLTYMLACLNEALRMYSPVAGGMPRSTPNGEAMVDGHLVPKDVSPHSSLLACSERIGRADLPDKLDNSERVPVGYLPPVGLLQRALCL
jgi:cytochrome P450